MTYRRKIRVELIKFIGGDRLLRLSYAPLELVLEKKLDPRVAVVAQKEKLLDVFEAALARANSTSAR